MGKNYFCSTETPISLPYEEGKIYKLCLIESTDMQNWTACDGAETTSITIKMENQTLSDISQKYSLKATAALDAESGGYVYTGMSNTINITVNNSGDKEYYDKVCVRVGTGDIMPDKDTYATGVTVPANGSTTFNFDYVPETAGTYNLWILDADEQPIGNASLTVKESQVPELSYVSIKCNNISGEKVYADFQGYTVEMDKVNDTKAEFTFKIKNGGGYYKGQFYILETNSNKFYEKTLKIPGEGVTTSFAFSVEGGAGNTVNIELLPPEEVTIAGLETKISHNTQDGGTVQFDNHEICYLAGAADAEKMAITYSVTDTDVDRLNTMLKENASITSIDLTGAASVNTAKEIKTGNPNTLLYVNKGAQTANTKNVIVKESDTYTCEILQLSDAAPFEAQYKFTAANATYERTGTNGWCSVYLPFAVSSIPNGITVEKFIAADTQNSTVTFEKVTSMDAYTPYIYNINGNARFGNSNVPIEKTEGQTGNAEFVGTLTGIAAPNLAGYYILKPDGSGFGIATVNATAAPFRAMIKVNGASGAPMLKAIHNGENGTTGISEFDADAENGGSYYNLRGEKVNTTTKGIYIKNGKKYILK